MTAPALNWLRRSLALAGVLAVGALIWFFGPLVAIAGRVPLAGEPARWAAIAALIALAAARVLWRSARAARRNRRLLDGLVAADAADPGRPGAKEVAEVGRRFEQAVALLRGSRIGGRKRNWRAALAGRPFVYELPWYIIIGAPGAGKTTALVNSGLEFPLAGEVGQPVIRGIGGTRNCDWWFAS
ncbi:MAG: type VI secretion system membrane subunit TssM, partial [Burkholderiaceae bacterium]